ncbi:MAG: hypothetical protein ACXWA3_13265 [Acidimicrobiales bacterium]
MADRTIQLVFSNPAEGRDADFDEWYNQVHLPEILATPGMVSAQRYDLYEAEIYRAQGATPPAHRYLTIYEMEGDVDAIMLKIREGVGSGAIVMSDCLDLTSSALSFWTPHGPKVEA